MKTNAVALFTSVLVLLAINNPVILDTWIHIREV